MIYTDGTPTVANRREKGPNFPRAAVGGERKPVGGDRPPQSAFHEAMRRDWSIEPSGYAGYATWPDPVGRAAGAYDEPPYGEEED